MKNQKVLLEKIRKAEKELVYATPKQAGKLAERIVRLKCKALKK